MFLRPDVEIIEKIWLMDGNGFFASAGGFLGLLLGTSCLYLIEQILSFWYISFVLSDLLNSISLLGYEHKSYFNYHLLRSYAYKIKVH